MNFLSGQDDFFRTGNQPISVRHLSQPYNKSIYFNWTTFLGMTVYIYTILYAYIYIYKRPDIKTSKLEFVFSKLEFVFSNYSDITAE